MSNKAKEFKVAKFDFFYKDQKKLKLYLIQIRTYLVLNQALFPSNTQRIL